MPFAARVGDTTGHGTPLGPGPGSPTVMIGKMPAWRALPGGIGGAVEAASNAMQSFMSLPSPVITPPSVQVQLVQIQQGFSQAASAAAAKGNPAGVAAASAAMAIVTTANISLTAAWTVASAVPGGLPAANVAYGEGIKAALAAAASSVFSAVAGCTDTHVCPIPCPIPPHGPGMVTKGSATVMINGLAAARQGDQLFEAAGGPDPIAMGCTTVQIGG
jgi:uncharacterized Zn-binding protein involved in type VI secretion